MSGFLRWYADKLKRHPMITNCISSSTIGGFGDVSAQIYRNSYCPEDSTDCDKEKEKATRVSVPSGD